MRIAECVERLLVDERHGVAAAHELHGLTNALAQVARTLGKVADEFGRDLGIRVGEERHAQLDQLAAQLVGVDEGAVVRERDNDAIDGREVRLRGFPALGAGGAVAHMTHGQLTGERRQVGIGEHAVEQARSLRTITVPPSPTAIPADSWPRCCSARRPKYVSRATSRSAPRHQKRRIPHAAGQSPDHTSTWRSPVPRRARPRGWFLETWHPLRASYFGVTRLIIRTARRAPQRMSSAF